MRFLGQAARASRRVLHRAIDHREQARAAPEVPDCSSRRANCSRVVRIGLRERPLEIIKPSAQRVLDVRPSSCRRGQARLARKRRAEHQEIDDRRSRRLRRRARAWRRRPPRSTAATRRRRQTVVESREHRAAPARADKVLGLGVVLRGESREDRQGSARRRPRARLPPQQTEDDVAADSRHDGDSRVRNLESGTGSGITVSPARPAAASCRRDWCASSCSESGFSDPCRCR